MSTNFQRKLVNMFLSFVLGAQKNHLNEENSFNLEAREVHIYRSGKTTITKPAKTTTGIYIRIPSDSILMPLPDETHRRDEILKMLIHQIKWTFNT